MLINKLHHASPSQRAHMLWKYGFRKSDSSDQSMVKNSMSKLPSCGEHGKARLDTVGLCGAQSLHFFPFFYNLSL